jgi:hypothetical protein
MRESDFKLNLLGGIGMYHRKAQIRRNRNRFKVFSNGLSHDQIFKSIENAKK